MLYYIPLEPYKERYTAVLSGKEGWFVQALNEEGVPHVRLEGESLRDTIKHGSVLDAPGRCYWALEQMKRIAKGFDTGAIRDGDVFYFEDMWHPGIEALAYMRHVMGKAVKIFTFCHAQSVDVYDFTHPMRKWMRPFEKGISEISDGIFVASTVLKDLLYEAGMPNAYVTGQVFNSKEVRSAVEHGSRVTRPIQVIYTSRLDPEKNPYFFLQVAQHYKLNYGEAHFVISTSAAALNSDPVLVRHFQNAAESGLVEIRVNQTRQQYYENLAQSRVQFNCAYQDFVSYTLTEACALGCAPVYPSFRSFPEALWRHQDCLYAPWSVADAARVLHAKLRDTGTDYRDVYTPHDLTVKRMLYLMGFNNVPMLNPYGKELL